MSRQNPLLPLVRVLRKRNKDLADAQQLNAQMAKITDTDGAGRYQLQFDRDASPTLKYYRTLSAVAVGNRVVVLKVGSSYVILGSLM